MILALRPALQNPQFYFSPDWRGDQYYYELMGCEPNPEKRVVFFPDVFPERELDKAPVKNEIPPDEPI